MDGTLVRVLLYEHELHIRNETLKHLHPFSSSLSIEISKSISILNYFSHFFPDIFKLLPKLKPMLKLCTTQAFMLKRATEEPLGRAASIVTDVLENAESNGVITAAQKRALLQELALRLS